MAKPTQEEALAEMDKAAQSAREEFDKMELDETTLEKISTWLKKWVPKAGWKRLGRMIAGKD